MARQRRKRRTSASGTPCEGRPHHDRLSAWRCDDAYGERARHSVAVLVMLSVVRIVKTTRPWYEGRAGA
ncbi:hypothetical protein GBZ48_34700 [Azospirillum melinis]|uniref:Transposase n=1 Tax=Azospirillum melinis TaxID=328839 RepID=A0ABX2KL50_9PROT|nr:hypothetical protein [Azospirillum melinis]